MTRHRLRAVLLLFLLLNLTACVTWQDIATPSQAQFIEIEQPDRVRVTMQDRTQMELERPVVDGDELVAPGVSMPLEDILLAVPEGYDPDSQAIVGLMAASLDDQSDQHV